LTVLSEERLCRDERILPLGHSPARLEIELTVLSEERLCRDERILPLGHSPAQLEIEQE
jgi:hypothetical protein